MGHIITDKGLLADSDKPKAILDMPPPADKEGVQRLLRLIQYLSKIIPNLSNVNNSLRVLLKSGVEFEWSLEQDPSFRKRKYLYSQPTALAIMSTSLSKSSAMPVNIAFRSLTDTETRYVQIEKEMLAILYSFKKFHNYIFFLQMKSRSTATTNHLRLFSGSRFYLHL